ncbi:5-carboxymethyl-2-hydroxymuconate Delta-isomerase [Streptomyces sp. H27-D2]|uniref:5-carboxymethyl-2-hydroxymuconate Delta-isomerase n=1 Tax=Streptomyces sp. H27-D2 TaxID=3046304 RepID=UPI002DB60CF2|nr:isomerase [Streptomyces sp. H27-D2]MEC4017201.1 isomerase [Streptomyces sp. H27-D2]
MPHIAVDYSDTLSGAFDRSGFGSALHPVIAKTVGASVEGCKTRFRRIDEAVIGDGSPGQAMIRIEVALLSGRAPESKSELSRAVLELTREHLATVPGLTVHTSVEISDMDRPSYLGHTEVYTA